jgi:hypothetical protein
MPDQAQPSPRDAAVFDDDIPVLDASGQLKVVHGGKAGDGAGSARPPAPPSHGNTELFDPNAVAATAALSLNAEVHAAVRGGAASLEAVWDKLADEAADESGLKLDEAAARRFHGLVTLYFRGLRDSLETKSKLTMSVASGGLGLSDDLADRVMAVITAKDRELQEALRLLGAEEKEAYLRRRVERHAHNPEAEEAAHHASLDAVHARVMGRELPKPPAPLRIVTVESEDKSEGEMVFGRPPANLPIAEEDLAPAGEGAKPAVAETKLAPTPPAGIEPPRPPAVSPTAEPQTAGTRPVRADKAAPVSPPVQVPAAPSSIIAPPPVVAVAAPLSAKPRVADVIAPQRLVGPIEELGAMTPQDFRRLSRDPKEACLKISDKLDLLGESSYAERTRGVAAWGRSGANRLYLDMLRGVMDGLPIAEVIRSREAVGQLAYSVDEFAAIRELHAGLRYR